MNKPTVGRIVHVLVDKRSNNGADIAPAILTRVWGDAGDRWTVNYRLLLDHNTTHGALQEWRTSAYLHEDEDAARAFVEATVGAGHVDGSSPEYKAQVYASRQGMLNGGMQAFWPPREG